ncbi:MAG: Hsp20/alpha crystallin family protein [Acidobacteria bacterium]|nr:Hsp20/alpha crystallin family protein [Acidobacteriota bacterium]
MSLVRFTPRSLNPWFGDNDRWLEDFFGAPKAAVSKGRGPFYPSVDIAEDATKIVLKTDLPGVEEKDIKVTVEDGTLTVSGERKFEKETTKEHFHRVERRFGSFTRSFALPENVDADQVSASYKKGVLEVTLPKTESKEKKVKVVSVN